MSLTCLLRINIVTRCISIDIARQPVDPDEEVSWAEMQGKRLKATREWWSSASTLGCLLVLTVASAPLRRLLQWVFSKEAHTYPDLLAFADRHGCRPSTSGGASEPVVSTLACGDYVTERLVDGAAHFDCQLSVGGQGGVFVWECLVIKRVGG